MMASLSPSAGAPSFRAAAAVPPGGGRIVPIVGAEIQVGTVLIENGKTAAVATTWPFPKALA